MKNPTNSFRMHFDKSEDVVLPQDLYFEQADNVRNAFGLFDYIPFNRIGEIEHFIALINNSPTAQSIVNKIATYTVGDGFYLLKERAMLGDKLAQELTEQQKTILWRVLSRKNSDGDTVLDVCRKAAYDYTAIGNAFAQLDVFSGITFVSHQPINFVRPFKSLDLRTKFYGVSADWAVVPYMNIGSSAYIKDVPAYPRFELELTEDDLNIFDKSAMLHLKKYSPLMYQWGLPTWTGAKHWAELEYRIAKFNVSKFKNGLTTSGLLQLFGDLTDEEKADYQSSFMDKMTGTGNDFKVIFQILENPELKANWIPMEQSYQGFFMELSDLSKDRIATGFEFPLSLIQATAGQLGNNQQIRSEFEILYRTKIGGIQKDLIEGIVKPYLDTVADNEGLPFLKDIELGFINVVPVSFAGDLDIQSVLTPNEARELLGYAETNEATIEETQQAQEQPKNGILNKIKNYFKR